MVRVLGVAVLVSRRGVEPRTSAFVAPRSVLLSYRDGAVCAHAPPRTGADRALRGDRPEVARGGREEPSGRFSERHGRSCRSGALAGSRSPPLGGGFRGTGKECRSPACRATHLIVVLCGLSGEQRVEFRANPV